MTDRFGQTESRASRNLNGSAPEGPESAKPQRCREKAGRIYGVS